MMEDTIREDTREASDDQSTSRSDLSAKTPEASPTELGLAGTVRSRRYERNASKVN